MISSKIIELQNNAIDEVIRKLPLKPKKDGLTFKAPTGSGKTVMIANIMNKMLEKNKNLIFIVTTLAKSDLGDQNHETFERMKNELKEIKPYIIDPSIATKESGYSIPIEYNVYSLTDALLRHGKKGSENNGTILSRGVIKNFLLELKQKNKQIIWIKDECHREYKNFQDLYDNNEYSFINKINVSATPQTTKFILDVVISENDATDAKLIKKLVGKDGYGRTYGIGNGYEDDKYKELSEALKILDQKRNDYSKYFNIRPCLIIQIQHKEKGQKELIQLTKLLDGLMGYGKPQFNYMYICDNENDFKTNTIFGNEDKFKKNRWKEEWKKEIKKQDSVIDIVIFKDVISEGFDIKRANMLFQIRDSESETLKEQVVGRIRRNPILLDWDKYDEDQHKCAMEAYVWGDIYDIERKYKKVQRVDDNNIPSIKIQTTKLKGIQQIYGEKGMDIELDYKDWKFPDYKESIFNLYKKWKNIDDDTKKMIWSKIKSYHDWFKYTYNIENINLENQRLYKDYNNTISISDIQELPFESYFEVLENTHRSDLYGPVTIKTKNDKFSWKIMSNDNDEKYFFDSLAEQHFAEELRYLNKKVWAKNYYANSKIGFEYVNITKHKSFPDFILVDEKDKIHIFEVKSFDVSNYQNVDNNEYHEKVVALQEFYKELTKKLENYIFYIIIKYQGIWDIYRYETGDETNSITLEAFKQLFE